MFNKLNTIRLKIIKNKLEKLGRSLKEISIIVNIIVIVLGTIWTYQIFVMEKRNVPQLNIDHITTHISLTSEINLIYVSVRIHNVGNIAAKIIDAEIRIQQILPIRSCDKPKDNECLINEIESSTYETDREKNIFKWPLLKVKKETYETVVLDPKESDYLNYEFAITSNVKVIRIYSYIKEGKKIKEDNKGWKRISFYSLTEGD